MEKCSHNKLLSLLIRVFPAQLPCFASPSTFPIQVTGYFHICILLMPCSLCSNTPHLPVDTRNVSSLCPSLSKWVFSHPNCPQGVFSMLTHFLTSLLKRHHNWFSFSTRFIAALSSSKALSSSLLLLCLYPTGLRKLFSLW